MSTIPPEFVVYDRERPSAPTKTCAVCGQHYTLHTGARCALCGDSVEHHDTSRLNGTTPLRFADCLAGAGRMARARFLSDGKVTELDKLVLAEVNGTAPWPDP